MKTLVIYESVFGNTGQIARAIGNGLGSQPDVGVVQVKDARLEELTGVELLIVGSPTRAFRPMDSIKSFINLLPGNALKGMKVAAFDTGIAASDIKSTMLRMLIKIGGYAAKPIAGLLRKKGGELIAPPEGFWVMGEKGPLKEGELERATEWARRIYSALPI